MRRERVAVRPDWWTRLEAVGFTFHSMGGVYWDEGVCYAFSADEIDQMEQVTAELQALCLEAVEHVVRCERFEELAIPPAWRERVVESWRSGEPALYGRFDFCYDGHHPPKLLEYNADTPTALLEAGVAQWFWLQDLHPDRDQFNSIHEKLIARWQALRAEQVLPLHLHFACVHDTEEDYRTVEYLRDTALQAGFTTFHVFVEDIGWDAQSGAFVDLEGRPIRGLFKLYPWEWLVREPFGDYLRGNVRLVEPCWKLLLSNKGLLPILWELFPDHPNLLPAFFTPDPLGGEYVKKPLFSREGANVEIHRPGAAPLLCGGGYGEEGWIYQAVAPLPSFDGENFVVLGSWVIGDEPAGLGLREDATPITRDTSRFVPHYFVP